MTKLAVMKQAAVVADAPVPSLVLTSGSTAEAILAAVASDPALPDALLQRAAAAYRKVYASCDGSPRTEDGVTHDADWQLCDAKWRHFGTLFGARLRMDDWSATPQMRRDMMVQSMRALLGAVEYFAARGPVQSGFKPQGPVPTVVHIARVNKVLHPLDLPREFVEGAAA